MAKAVAAGAVIGEGSPGPASSRGRISRARVVVVAAAIVVVTIPGLGVQAVRGNRVVAVQRDAHTIHNALLDDAFYHCLDVQARSLISPGEPIVFDADLGDLVTLIKGVGSWVTIADPASSAVVRLSLRNNVSGGGACLGTVVVATFTTPGHGVKVRLGSGSSVPGKGPPPAPPL